MIFYQKLEIDQFSYHIYLNFLINFIVIWIFFLKLLSCDSTTNRDRIFHTSYWEDNHEIEEFLTLCLCILVIKVNFLDPSK